MSLAFEITEEDVAAVLLDNGDERGRDENYQEQCLQALDTAAVEKAALYGNELDEQTSYAYQDILRQLREQEMTP